MELRLNLKKTVEQNAAEYFERSKKFKSKAKGAEEAIARLSAIVAKLEKEDAKKAAAQLPKKPVVQRPLAWFEKFRWFRSSEGFLCIGGRDSSTNEIVIKKHTDPTDIVFHTDAPGSPFFVVKTEGKVPGEATLKEVGLATAAYSRGWKLGVAVMDVFWVKPEQVSKEAAAGEFIAKGAFMVRGRRNVFSVPLELAVGIADDGLVMGGPEPAVRANCKKVVKIIQGKDKSSDCAKRVQKLIGCEIDDIQRVLPAGGCAVKG